MLIGVIVPYVTLSDETAHAEPQFYAGAFVGLGNFDNQFEDVEGFVGYGENYQLDYDDSDTHFGALAGIQWQLEGFDIAVEFDLSSLNISTDKVADPVGLDETVSSEMDGFASVRTQVAIPLTERFSVHAAFGLAVTEIQNEFVDLDWYWIDEAAGIAEQRFDPDDSCSDDSV